MKKYIQLTAGRGPAECARTVALVARELLKDFPMQNLWFVLICIYNILKTSVL